MTVRLERSGGMTTLTMDRPAKRNAMTDEMWETFADHLEGLEPGGRDRVLVVTGAGGAFCGGSDVGGLLDDPASLRDRIEVSNRCVLAMRDLPIPTIAKVGGVAAGSGVNLALACDFVLASDSARFIQVFIHRALSLDSGASWLLPRLVGERHARELCFLGDSLLAGDAARLGLITSVHAEDALDDAVAHLAERLCASSAVALAGTKRLLNETWTKDLAGALSDEADNQLAVISGDMAKERISGFGSSGPPEGRS